MSFDATLREMYGRKTTSVCPKCGKTHKLKMFWTGRGTPRCYCPVCQQVTASRSGGLDEGYSFNRRAAVTRISTQP